MKVIYTMISLVFITLNLFSQNLKVNQAEHYFKSYRFAEATPIYKELIEKDHLKIDLFESVYKDAVISAEKSKDYSFAYSTMDKLSSTKNFSNEDAYHFFQLSLLTSNYSKAKELIFKGIVISNGANKLDLAKLYFDGKIWDDILKDSSKFKIKEVDFNSNKGDFGAFFHPNGIVFSSARDLAAKDWSYDNSAFLNIYLLNKNNKIETLNFLKSSRHDGTACYDSINKLWYFARNFDAKKNNQLTTTGIFIYDEKSDKEVPFKYNSDSLFTAQPFLSEDGNKLWFSSNRKGGQGNADIWYCLKTFDGWSEPINAGDFINTSQNEMFPFFQKNKLYFASNGQAGLGGLDLFSVIYENEKPSNLKNLGSGINSNLDDFSLVLDKTGKFGYMSSNRIEIIDHIYSVLVKTAEFVLKGELVADFKGKEDLTLIPIVVKENGNIIDTLYADKDGNFEFKTEKNEDFTFEINNDRFFPLKETFSTKDKVESDTTFKKLTLQSKYITINATVIDQKSKKPIPFSKVVIKDDVTGEEKTFTADDKGYFSTELERNKLFETHSSHQGYFDGNSEISTVSKDSLMKQDIELKFISKGTTIAIENVFYDFGKATLRPESKVELDKLAEFLKENPKLKVELSSHTDSRGGDARNLVLSQQRAQSCVDYLISIGINKNNIVAKGYGETKLINRCKNGVTCTEDEHQKNRRTEIKVL